MHSPGFLDNDELETCPICKGSGIEDKCEECRREQDEEEFERQQIYDGDIYDPMDYDEYEV
jgi:methionyl-tRNA synthetase